MGFATWRMLGWLWSNEDRRHMAFCEACGPAEVRLSTVGEYELATCIKCGESALED